MIRRQVRQGYTYIVKPGNLVEGPATIDLKTDEEIANLKGQEHKLEGFGRPAPLVGAVEEAPNMAITEPAEERESGPMATAPKRAKKRKSKKKRGQRGPSRIRKDS